VTSVKLAQNGKHGGMKARITGKCVFTGAKQDNFFIGKELLQVPTVKKDVFQLSCIDEEEGIKYFNEDDEAIAFSLKQENKTVAFFLGVDQSKRGEREEGWNQ
jgi:translation elongation factor P/translation initiation factor 5A